MLASAQVALATQPLDRWKNKFEPVERVTEAGAFIWFVAFCHPCYGFPYLFLSYEGFRPPALTLVGLYPFASIFHPLRGF